MICLGLGGSSVDKQMYSVFVTVCVHYQIHLKYTVNTIVFFQVLESFVSFHDIAYVLLHAKPCSSDIKGWVTSF